ncbi:hypothetical protein OS493_016649 [Desmophyllum pertusum]|uniref:Uncharacterized protein n=1 Tax=Desmophyllum pertusum TaxID=174260 RepID=A0A9W9ZD07_9CNID|nr:hypothetical protein OS493_016649 [Desmophyllum pertusum]
MENTAAARSRILACKKILKTGLWNSWPHSTVLCCFIYRTYDKEDSQDLIFQQIYQNEAGREHPEPQMLKDRAFLSNFKAENAAYDIILVLNYSPCHLRADKLLVFIKNTKLYIQ